MTPPSASLNEVAPSACRKMERFQIEAAQTDQPPRYRLRVEPSIRQLAQTFQGVVLYVQGLRNAATDGWSDRLLADAELHVQGRGYKPLEHPHMRAWGEVYRAFGAHPKRYRNGCLALALRERVPRINALVDAYNAVALRQMLPIGGEDWDRLESDLVRTRATGHEPFVGNDAGGSPEHPEQGEPIWCDRLGVTTRRFNWRQARRTRIEESTRAAFFVFDTVAPYGLENAVRAASCLRSVIEERWPDASFEEHTL